MTDQELKDLVAQNALQLNLLQANTLLFQEESRAASRQLRRTISNVGKQIGDLGNKFGKFTEGLFFPSLMRILSERFGITNTTSRLRVTDLATREVVMELDGFGYANSAKNVAVVIEIKTELREEDLQNLLAKLKRFDDVFPEHRDKKLFGVIAATILPDNLRQRALNVGLFVASISDEAFRLTGEPDQPRDFSQLN